MSAPSGTTEHGGDPPAAPAPVVTDAPVRLRFSPYSIVRAVLVVVVALMILVLVRAASTTLWWLAIAAVVAAMFQPAVLYLQRFMKAWIAMIVVLIVVLAATGLVGYKGFDELRSQFDTVRTNAINAARDAESSKQLGEVAKEFGLTAKVTQAFEDLPFAISDADTASAVQTAASSGGALFAIATLAVLMLIFGRRIVRSTVHQIDQPVVQLRVKRLLKTAYGMSSRYAYLMAGRALVIGFLAFAIASLLGLDAPTAIGVWFAVMSLLPGFGLVLAALPLVAYEAVTAIPVAVLMFCAALLVQVGDIVFVQRRIEATSMRLGPSITLVASLIGLQLYGVGGLLVVLGFVLFGLAALRTLTRDHPDAFTAVRTLVSVD